MGGDYFRLSTTESLLRSRKTFNGTICNIDKIKLFKIFISTTRIFTRNVIQMDPIWFFVPGFFRFAYILPGNFQTRLIGRIFKDCLAIRTLSIPIQVRPYVRVRYRQPLNP